MMKFPLIFLILDILMVAGYGLAVFANFFRRLFHGRTKP
jgi:hypothetical protein